MSENAILKSICTSNSDNFKKLQISNWNSYIHVENCNYYMSWEGWIFILAWKIPWTEEPGRLQSMESLRVGHDWMTSLSLFTFMHWRRKWQLTPVFLPGESRGRGSLVGCRLWGRTESDTTEVTSQQQQQHSYLNSTQIKKWDIIGSKEAPLVLLVRPESLLREFLS